MTKQNDDQGKGGDGGGDGGGGGATPFSDEQKQEMIRLQNAANSAHHSRITKVMEQRFDELRTTMADEFKGMLSSVVGGSGAGAGSGNAPPPPGDDGGNAPEVERVRQEYEARMTELEKRFKASESRRQEEHDRNLRNEERSKLETTLRAAGIADERIRPAVALLYTEDRRVGRTKSDDVVFRVQRDGYVDDLPLDQGVEEWLKTPEGKHFAPSRETRGSGATAGSARTSSNGRPSRAELKRDLVNAVLNAERQGVS